MKLILRVSDLWLSSTLITAIILAMFYSLLLAGFVLLAGSLACYLSRKLDRAIENFLDSL